MAWLGGKGNGSKAPPLRPFPHLPCTAKLTSQFGTKKVQLLQDEVHMYTRRSKGKNKCPPLWLLPNASHCTKSQKIATGVCMWKQIETQTSTQILKSCNVPLQSSFASLYCDIYNALHILSFDCSLIYQTKPVQCTICHNIANGNLSRTKWKGKQNQLDSSFL